MFDKSKIYAGEQRSSTMLRKRWMALVAYAHRLADNDSGEADKRVVQPTTEISSGPQGYRSGKDIRGNVSKNISNCAQILNVGFRVSVSKWISLPRSFSTAAGSVAWRGVCYARIRLDHRIWPIWLVRASLTIRGCLYPVVCHGRTH